MSLKICICGGGALGHVISGILASKNIVVNLLTSQPKKWRKEITTFLPDGKKIKSKLNIISSKPEDVICDVDYILFCLPGYIISDTLRKIKPFVRKNTVVGSVVGSTGFFWMAKSILPEDTPIFAFQRVPFIARVKDYGSSSYLKGYRSLLKVASISNHNTQKLIKDLTNYLDTPVELLDSIWPAAITNSNPLLHSSRLYSLFKNYKQDETFNELLLFYESWNLESSELLLEMDEELNRVIEFLPFKKSKLQPLKVYYESKNPIQLTSKLRSIPAFKGITLQMQKTEDGYIPDWGNRYFTEDIPFGLVIIKDFAEYFDVDTPTINMIINWAQKNMGKEYLINNKLVGADVSETGVLRNFISSIDEIL